MLSRRRKERYPNLTVEGYPIVPQRSAKYLKVHLQQELTGTAHVRKIVEEASAAPTNISKILPRTYGASESQRRVLSMVAQSIAFCMYAAPAWGPRALRFKTNRGALERAQRISAIPLTRAYRTTSTPTLLVLARIIP